MTSAGAQSLADLRNSGCLEACISLVGTTADVDSRGVQLAVMLLRDFADWDVASRCAKQPSCTVLGWKRQLRRGRSIQIPLVWPQGEHRDIWGGSSPALGAACC